MGLSRQGYWSALAGPPPGNLLFVSGIGRQVLFITSKAQSTSIVVQPLSRVWLCASMNCSTRGFPVLSLSTSISSVQFSSVAQSCPTLFDPMNHSMPGLPVHHQLPESTQTHVHRVSDPIQPSHLLLSPFPPAPNPSQHQSLFQWVNSSHQVAKLLEFQL